MFDQWHRTNLTDLKDPIEGIRESRKDVYHYFKKGWTKRKTAKWLHLHERTVGRWYVRFVKEGNPIHWRDARGARAGDVVTEGKEDLIAHLIGIVTSKKTPRNFGLKQDKWNVATIALYIEQRYGKRPSLRTVYRYFKFLKIVQRCNGNYKAKDYPIVH